MTPAQRRLVARLVRAGWTYNDAIAHANRPTRDVYYPRGMSMRTLIAKAIRGTPAGPDRVALIIEATPTDTTETTELFELVLGRREVAATMRDILDIILETWPYEPA